MTPNSGAAFFQRWRTGAVICALSLSLLATFSQVRHYGFVRLDDPVFIYKNPHIAHGLTWEGIRWAFTADLTHDSPNADYWQPVTWISRMLDIQLFGLNPAGHHLMNLLFHMLNAVLLFLLFHQLTGAFWRSALLGFFFGLHPLQADSVAWVTERKDVLSVFLGLLALTAYTAHIRSPSAKRWGLTVSFAALAVMAKPSMVMLPVVFLLLDFWPLGRFHLNRSVTRQLLEATAAKWPFFLFSAIGAVATLIRHPHEIDQASWIDFLGRASSAYVRYAGKIFFPVNLTVWEPSSGQEVPLVSLVLSAAGLMIISWVVFSGKKRPYLLFGWAWFLLTLVPVTGLEPADRFTYFPMIGIGVMLLWGLCDLTERWRFRRAAAWAVGGCFILLAAGWTRVQVRRWQDNAALFQDALKSAPDNYVAHLNLGITLAERGGLDKAVGHFREALKAKPDLVEAHINLGNVSKMQGKQVEAAGHYRKALAIDPRSTEALNNMGVLLAERGNPAEAVLYYWQALNINPDSANVLTNLGAALADQGKFEEAADSYTAALAIDPVFADAYYNLGNLFLEQGRVREAVRQYQTAVRLKPGFEPARKNLERALLEMGRAD